MITALISSVNSVVGISRVISDFSS
jgi:hypothetical protein